MSKNQSLPVSKATLAVTPSTPNTPSTSAHTSLLDATFLSDIDTPEAHFLKNIPFAVKQLREQFLSYWLELLQLERAHTHPEIFLSAEPTLTRAELTKKRQEVGNSVKQQLKLYCYHLNKESLDAHGALRTDEIRNLVETLKSKLAKIGENPEELENIIQNTTLSHGKELEFKGKTLRLFIKESLISHIAYEKRIYEISEELKNKEKSIERKIDNATRPLHKQLAETQTENQNLKTEIRTFEDTTIKQGKKIKELLKTIEDKEQENLAIKDTVNEQGNLLNETLEEFKTVQTESEKINETRKTIAGEQELEVSFLQGEALKLIQTNKQLETEKTTLLETTETQSSAIRRLGNDLAALVVEKNNNQLYIDSLKDEIADYINENIKLREESQANSSKYTYEKQNLYAHLEERDNRINQLTHIINSQPTIAAPTIAIPVINQNQQIQNLGMGDADPIAQHLGELFSREDKKTIPFYKGTSSEVLITDWIRKAERVATNNDWNASQKIRFFSDRLKSEAADWHEEYINEDPIARKLDYAAWKIAITERFQDDADLDKLRSKLNGLKQHSEQRTRAFVAKINSLYDTIHGKERTVNRANNAERLLGEDIQKMRDQEKRKILLKGLLPKVKAELWPRMHRDATYEALCDLAYTAENVVINKELSEDKGINAVIAGISHHEEQQDNEISNQKKELEQLRKRVEFLTVSNSDNNSQENHSIPTVAVADNYRPRSQSGDRRPSRSSNRLQFRDPPSRPQSADRGYQRPQGTDNHYSRGRSPSAGQYDRRDSYSGTPYDIPRYHQRPGTPNPGFQFAKPQFSNPPPNFYRNYQTNYPNSPRQDSFRSNNFNPNFNPRRTFQNPRYQQKPYNPNSRYSSLNSSNWKSPDPQARPRQSLRDITCHKCGFKGHIARECQSQKARQSPQQQ